MTAPAVITEDALVDGWVALKRESDPPRRGFIGDLTPRQTAGFILWEARKRSHPQPIVEGLDVAVAAFVNALPESKPYWREVAALFHQVLYAEEGGADVAG